MYQTSQSTVGAQGQGDDRALVLPVAGGLVLAVCDGAGGTGRGAAAAERVVRAVAEWAHAGASDACGCLRAVDGELAREGGGGETTAVIAVLRETGVTGASVGDSEAWIVSPRGHEALTRHQSRKPLLGSGRATPVLFVAAPLLNATLLVGSDGLFKYGNAARLRELALAVELDAAPLIASVRLRSGALQDDTTVLLCRGQSG
jgi:PPM family protein phosphatase